MRGQGLAVNYTTNQTISTADALHKNRCDEMNRRFVEAVVASRTVLDNKPTTAERRALMSALRKLATSAKEHKEAKGAYEAEVERLLSIHKDAEFLAAQEIRLKDIARAVAKRYDLTVDQMLVRKNHRTLVYARQEAMYLASVLTLLSSSQIGKFFDRDHSTVLHGIERHKARLEAAGP